jgi:hypothetical protein
MEASTTIRQMLRGNEISVPGYQRAYSWDSRDDDRDIKTQTDVFLADIKQHIGNNVQTQYYLGHFLFEKIQSPVLGRPSNRFYVIDGQQRLTTIVILMSAVNLIIKNLYNDGNARSDDEIELFEDIVKRNNVYRLSIVHYDDFFFRGYVINQDTSDKSRRSHWFVLLFALSCALGSVYGFLQGAWPFGLVEAIWSVVALRRWITAPHG